MSRQRAQEGRWRPMGVYTCPGGQAIQEPKIRGRIGCQKSGADQYKGGGWGGGVSQDTDGDEKRSSNQFNGGADFI